MENPPAFCDRRAGEAEKNGRKEDPETEAELTEVLRVRRESSLSL